MFKKISEGGNPFRIHANLNTSAVQAFVFSQNTYLLFSHLYSAKLFVFIGKILV